MTASLDALCRKAAKRSPELREVPGVPDVTSRYHRATPFPKLPPA